MDDLEAPLVNGGDVGSSSGTTTTDTSIALELRDLEFFAGNKALCGSTPASDADEAKRRILCGVNAVFSPGKVTALVSCPISPHPTPPIAPHPPPITPPTYLPPYLFRWVPRVRAKLRC